MFEHGRSSLQERSSRPGRGLIAACAFVLMIVGAVETRTASAAPLLDLFQIDLNGFVEIPGPPGLPGIPVPFASSTDENLLTVDKDITLPGPPGPPSLAHIAGQVEVTVEIDRIEHTGKFSLACNGIPIGPVPTCGESEVAVAAAGKATLQGDGKALIALDQFIYVGTLSETVPVELGYVLTIFTLGEEPQTFAAKVSDELGPSPFAISFPEIAGLPEEFEFSVNMFVKTLGNMFGGDILSALGTFRMTFIEAGAVVAPAPAPASLLLLVLGLAAMWWARRAAK